MPFMVGILNEQWEYYKAQNGIEALVDKCVIEINPENTLSVLHFD